MHGSVIFDGEKSASFDVNSGVSQGGVLASTPFGIFFSTLRSKTAAHTPAYKKRWKVVYHQITKVEK
jgi:hypothetical protein